MWGCRRSSTFRPRRFSDRVRRTLGRWEDDHGLLVMVLGQGPYEPRLWMVRVIVGVAVLVANSGRGHVTARLSGTTTGPTAAAAAGCSTRNKCVVGDVRRIAQAWLLAVVRAVSVIWKLTNLKMKPLTSESCHSLSAGNKWIFRIKVKEKWGQGGAF